MISFIYAAFLIAGLAAAWPIYQHFRNQKQRIQKVPSLQLFRYQNKPVRRYRVRNLWLMLMRVLMIIGLMALIAFPIFESSKELSLPLTHRQDPEQKYLCLLIDDSVASTAVNEGRTRLQVVIEQLKKEIDELPEEVRYFVATSSFPVVGRSLNRQELLQHLDQVKPCPQEGFCTLAYKALLDKTSDKLSAFIICSPRRQELWQIDEDLLPEQKRSLHFVDTTDWRRALALTAIETQAVKEGILLKVTLRGETSQLNGQKIIVRRDGVAIASHQVNAFEAEKLSAQFKLPPSVTGGAISLSLASDKSAITELHSIIDGDKDNGRNITIVAPDGKDYDQAFAILSAAVENSLPPGGRIIRRRIEDLKQQDISNCQTLTLIGYSRFPANKSGLINNALKQGKRFVFFPPISQISETGTKIIAWRKDQLSRSAYLKFTTSDEELELADLAILNLREFANGARHSVRFARAGKSLCGAEDMTLISRSQFGPKSSFVGASIPLSLSNPFVYHPAFPLIMEKLLIAPAEKKEKRNFFLGNFFDISTMTAEGSSSVKLPSGAEKHLELGQKILFLTDCGIYRFADGQQLAVNNLLPPPSTDIQRDLWSARFSHSVQWQEPDSDWPKPEFLLNHKPVVKEYDLTFLFLYAFLLFFILEEIFLWNAWRRRSA